MTTPPIPSSSSASPPPQSSASFASSPAPDPASRAITSLSILLDQPLRITILDNRIFIGLFICVDPQCNIILAQAEEFRPPLDDVELERNREMYWPKSQRGPGEGEGWGGRQVGMILLPGKAVVKIEVEEGWEERRGG